MQILIEDIASVKLTFWNSYVLMFLAWQVKSMYQKVANQNDSLRGLWAAKFNLKGGKSGLATQEDIAAYEAKLHELERELERRKEIGRKFEAVLKRVRDLMEADEQAREDHEVREEHHLCSLPLLWCTDLNKTRLMDIVHQQTVFGHWNHHFEWVIQGHYLKNVSQLFPGSNLNFIYTICHLSTGCVPGSTA